MAVFENEKFKYDKHDFKQIDINGKRTKVYRIISKINFCTRNQMIVEGQKGGYCALGTLSEKGTCWVDQYSVVGPNCYVSCYAYIEKSLLAHDCSVSGRAFVGNSQINPNESCGIVENARVMNSKIKGDLYMGGASKLIDSTVNGDLKMQDEANLAHCLMNAEKQISVAGTTQISFREISGEGIIGVSDKIELKEIENGITK